MDDYTKWSNSLGGKPTSYQRKDGIYNIYAEILRSSTATRSTTRSTALGTMTSRDRSDNRGADRQDEKWRHAPWRRDHAGHTKDSEILAEVTE